MAIDILRRIRERSYQIWEQEERPEGRPSIIGFKQNASYLPKMR